MEKVDENLSDLVPMQTPESNDADTTFEPTIDELMDELIDDEQTLREEEDLAALENDNPLDEINTLKEESEMPLEELLAKYSAMAPMPSTGPARKKLKKSAKKNSKSKTQVLQADIEKENPADVEVEEVINETNEPEEINGSVANDNDTEDSTAKEADNDVASHIEQKTSEKLKIRRSHLFELYPEQNFDSTLVAAQNQESMLCSEDENVDDADEEEEVEPDYVKKTIMVGSAFQAVIPGLSQYGDILPYENEDKLIWEPSQVSETEVEEYLLKIREIKSSSTDEESTTTTTNENKNVISDNVDDSSATSAVNSAGMGADHLSATKSQIINENKNIETDTSNVVKDNEQALHLLVQCGYDFKEALRRKRLNSVPLTGGAMSIWSEEECQKFEEGIQKFGKDFLKIRQNQVRTRTMRELVQFYYLWKKSERRDHNFANADTVDHMDIYLNEGDYSTSSSSTPVLAAASTLMTGRKINGCSQNNFSIMTGSIASNSTIGNQMSSSPTKSRKRTSSDASNSNFLNSGGSSNTLQSK